MKQRDSERKYYYCKLGGAITILEALVKNEQFGSTLKIIELCGKWLLDRIPIIDHLKVKTVIL